MFKILYCDLISVMCLASQALVRYHLQFRSHKQHYYPQQNLNCHLSTFCNTFTERHLCPTYKDLQYDLRLRLEPSQVNVTLPDWKTKELRRAYYSTISYIDSEIGRFSSFSSKSKLLSSCYLQLLFRVLSRLEELGLAESTV